jgi:hypothetical protein
MLKADVNSVYNFTPLVVDGLVALPNLFFS